MIALKGSWLATYFDDVDELLLSANDCSLLDDAEALIVWHECVGGNGRHFYELHGDSWLLGVKWEVVGSWVNFSDEDRQELSEKISTFSQWSPSEELFLIQDRGRIVKMTFEFFSTYWRELLLAFDDGPLLISCAKKDVAFRFAPLGSILFVSRC